MTGRPNSTGFISSYLDMLAGQRQLSDHTLEGYRRDLEELASLAAPATLSEIRSADLRRFMTRLHAGGLSPRSISRKLSAWRGFFRWLLEENIITANPAEDIHAPRKDKPLPKALPVDEAVRLVATVTGDDDDTPDSKSRALCDHAMFELLYSSGLRVSELAGLDIHAVRQPGYISAGWIDLDEKEVTVTGKGNKTRTVPVGDAAIDAIRNWLTVRPTSDAESDIRHAHALFLNSRRRRMSPRLIQSRLNEHARRLGLPVHVHPHVLRHSFASHLLQSSGDLRAVQELLGHASIASTQVYTALDFQHLASVYDATHPRAHKKKNTP